MADLVAILCLCYRHVQQVTCKYVNTIYLQETCCFLLVVSTLYQSLQLMVMTLKMTKRWTNTFILTIDQLTTCNEKAFARMDEPTGNYNQTLQFSSALQDVLASFISLFLLYGLQLYSLGSLSPISLTLFTAASGSCFQQKNSDKLTECYLSSTNWQTDNVCD